MYQGYPFLLRHAGTVVKTMGIFCGALAVGGLSQKLLMSYGAENALLYRLYRSGFQVLILGLGVPVSAVWLYRKRADGMRTIALLALAQAFYLASLRLSRGFRPGGFWIPVLVLLLTCLGTELYLAGKGWLGGKRWKTGAASSRSGGSLSPGFSSPERIISSIWLRNNSLIEGARIS